MEWLCRGWDQAQTVAASVGILTGVVLVVLGFGALAALAAPALSIVVRWAFWQIPPPGRSRAGGTPPDAISGLARVAVVVLLVTLALAVLTAPFR